MHTINFCTVVNRFRIIATVSLAVLLLFQCLFFIFHHSRLFAQMQEVGTEFQKGRSGWKTP